MPLLSAEAMARRREARRRVAALRAELRAIRGDVDVRSYAHLIHELREERGRALELRRR